jgi:hypothetical protein
VSSCFFAPLRRLPASLSHSRTHALTHSLRTTHTLPTRSNNTDFKPLFICYLLFLSFFLSFSLSHTQHSLLTLSLSSSLLSSPAAENVYLGERQVLERGQVRGERGRLRLCRGVQAGAGRRVWRGGGGPAPDPQGTRAEGRRGAGLLRRGGWPDRAPGEGRQVARPGQQLCPPRQLRIQQLARCVHVQSTCSAALPSMLPCCPLLTRLSRLQRCYAACSCQCTFILVILTLIFPLYFSQHLPPRQYHPNNQIHLLRLGFLAPLRNKTNHSNRRVWAHSVPWVVFLI